MIEDKNNRAQTPADRVRTSKRRILIVEDEPINQQILAAYLESDYELIIADSGEQAKTTIERENRAISLILLDLNLPDLHGLDILRWIKAGSTFSKIPVIVMTSDGEAEVESLNIGAIDFITKPYPLPKVVQARVRRTIELSEGRDLIRETERDGLTGLYTREYFFRYADQFDQFHKDTPMDALILDINHFHMINERFGKGYADRLLQRVGRALYDYANRSGGIACRRNADTFLLYCPHGSDYADAVETVTAAACEEEPGHVRIRVGVYANVDPSIDMELRFDRAKSAADLIKNDYTTCIATYDNDLHEKEIYEERLLEDFHDALVHKQFKVYFQPKFDIRPEKPLLCGAEALVRWVHPVLGFVSPGAFVPLFESNGLVRQLDDYVWRETAACQGRWKKKFGREIPVSVNVSRVDALDPDLADMLCRLTEANGISNSALHLEITESAYTDDAKQIISTVSKLREKGFVIEMDDFGSGYSSISMISTLPIDVMKLDRMLIVNALKEQGNIRMLKVIIDMADSLSVPLIAEGVETEEQFKALKDMGCEMIQGYYFAKPMPEQDFEQYLAEKHQNNGIVTKG